MVLPGTSPGEIQVRDHSLKWIPEQSHGRDLSVQQAEQAGAKVSGEAPVLLEPLAFNFYEFVPLERVEPFMGRV
jgi:hypothetical protein